MKSICSIAVLLFLAVCSKSKLASGAAVVSGQHHGSLTCSEDRSLQADKCLAQLAIFGDRTFVPPRTQTDMREFCRQGSAATKCVRQYASDCLDPLSRQLTNVALRGLHSTIRKQCTTDKQRKRFLRHMECSVRRGMNAVHTCMEVAVSRVEFVRDRFATNGTSQDELIRVPAACCAIRSLEQCVTSVVGRDCAHNGTLSHVNAPGGQESSAFVASMLDGAMGDFLDMLCSRWPTQQVCAEQFPAVEVMFAEIQSELQAGTRIKSSFHSLLIPMIQILSK